MRAVLFFIFGLSCFAQIPTLGLVEQYDMTTLGGGGTTLTDLSGNGRNGTLHGTTPGAKGITFNGTSDYISIPTVVANADFTAMVFLSTVNNTGTGYDGVAWGEENNAGSTSLQLSTDGSTTSRIITGNGSGGANFSFFAGNSISFNTDYLCYYIARTSIAGSAGILDKNISQTISLGTITTTPTLAAIGARLLNAGPDFFWGGTVAYVLVYNRQLTQQEMQNAYATVATTLAARNVYMRDLISPVTTSPVWNRQGPITGVTGSPQEPTAAYTTTDCSIVSNPCFQLWYSTSSIQYTESKDGLAWATPVTALTAGLNGESSVIKVGSTYYLFEPNAANTQIDEYSSATPTGFTLAHTSVIPLGSAGAFDATHLYNSSIAVVGSTWYMGYEATGGSITNRFQCGGATSPDGITWTKVAANPISGYGDQSGCSAPFIANIGGKWWLWATGAVSPYANNYRKQSISFNNVFQTAIPSTNGTGAVNAVPQFTGTALDESAQVADSTFLEVNGKTYMYYTAQSGSVFKIKLAIANMPMSQLVLTTEGALTNVP